MAAHPPKGADDGGGAEEHSGVVLVNVRPNNGGSGSSSGGATHNRRRHLYSVAPSPSDKPGAGDGGASSMSGGSAAKEVWLSCVGESEPAGGRWTPELDPMSPSGRQPGGCCGGGSAPSRVTSSARGAGGVDSSAGPQWMWLPDGCNDGGASCSGAAELAEAVARIVGDRIAAAVRQASEESAERWQRAIDQVIQEVSELREHSQPRVAQTYSTFTHAPSVITRITTNDTLCRHRALGPARAIGLETVDAGPPDIEPTRSHSRVKRGRSKTGPEEMLQRQVTHGMLFGSTQSTPVTSNDAEFGEEDGPLAPARTIVQPMGLPLPSGFPGSISRTNRGRSPPIKLHALEDQLTSQLFEARALLPAAGTLRRQGMRGKGGGGNTPWQLVADPSLPHRSKPLTPSSSWEQVFSTTPSAAAPSSPQSVEEGRRSVGRRTSFVTFSDAKVMTSFSATSTMSPDTPAEVEASGAPADTATGMTHTTLPPQNDNNHECDVRSERGDLDAESTVYPMATTDRSLKMSPSVGKSSFKSSSKGPARVESLRRFQNKKLIEVLRSTESSITESEASPEHRHWCQAVGDRKSVV